MNEKRSTYRSGRIRGRLAGVFCLMLAAVLLPVLAFAAPRTDSDVKATYLNSAVITLSATGANATYCQLDSGAVVATKTCSTGVYGPHVLKFWSTDATGAVETAVNAPFFVDEDVAPTLECNAVASYVVTASITITATDNFHGSGVDFVCYRVDDGAYQTVFSPASVAATKLLVARLAKVQVGLVDLMAPVDPTLPPQHEDRGACASCHDIIVPTPEPTSTPEPVVTMSPSVTITGTGTHTLEYWAQDLARNTTAHVTKTFVITPQVIPVVKVATTLKFSASTHSAKSGTYVTLSAKLSGGTFTNQYVRFEVKMPGASGYGLIKRVKVTAAGYAHIHYKVAAKGTRYLRVRFLGDSDYLAALVPSAWKLVVK